MEDDVAQVVAALDSIAGSRAMPRDEKRVFFRRAQHCYGRSALLLSGSGSFLFFHIGVVEALWNEGVLPTILAGSSGGSIVPAIACPRRVRDLRASLASHRLGNPARASGRRRNDPARVEKRPNGPNTDRTLTPHL